MKLKLLTQRSVVSYIDSSKYTARFECDLDESGYIMLNLPVAKWKEMGEPMEILVTYEPTELIK